MLFEETYFTVCRAEPGRQTIGVVAGDTAGRPYRSFAAMDRALPGRPVSFAMNAGMFDDNGSAIGLLVSEGRPVMPLNRRSGSGNFHLRPNGVFFGDAAGWHVTTAARFAAAPPTPIAFATQSGPMLAIDGAINPAFSHDGTSLYRRNGVGVDAQGIAWFAISDEPVSFGRFARLFRDRLGCAQALYLDGYVSSLWNPAAGRRDDAYPLGPIVVALATR